MSSLEQDRIGIIGAGAAGLITAHTLIQDGYKHVEILTRDPTPGGIWSAGRVYPGLVINNIQGEYRFSNLEQPPPMLSEAGDIRLSGQDLQAYMEKFVELFLPDRIRYNKEVISVRATARGGVDLPHDDNHVWTVMAEDVTTRVVETREYDKLVLCTGGCSEPHYPLGLSPKEARLAGFQGPVIHSSDYASRMQELLDAVKPASEGGGTLLVIGGGKSGSDIAAHMADKGRKVTMIFTTIDAAVAAPIPLPRWLVRGRFFSALSPHIELRTSLERFLHTTWVGSKLVHGFWDAYQWLAFKTLQVPNDSPLRRAPKLFWSLHANNQGSGALGLFYRLVNEGRINVIAPARVSSFSEDAQAVVLSDGRLVYADAVVLGTGYLSSWNKIFDGNVTVADISLQELGLGTHTLHPTSQYYRWDYTTLENSPPLSHPAIKSATSSIYRGIVPAKNILRRNFAINGAIGTTNVGYAYETTAHWIASYFRGDKFLRLPSSVEEALASASYNAAWLRKRYPDQHMCANDSVRSDFALWCWPQMLDTLLDDMQLPTMRSGGNALTWPFQVIDVKEIAHLKEEREALRTSMS
ncbi:FAD/NAD(P)-binding domain-containing protein [Daedalea quercina L-15889]|uniref:FAD/NAD(P)-binding domain-containing protein n=1 Tax=Daedalea quercina L-15889 TaxID=1314783 RepID=A0A165QH87_9APHY|nr:FAD/NAD(P)-binding domain-containing protein [Daedalea quercina L-15889]